MLDASRPEPLYSQLRDLLQRQIEGGVLPVGTRLPTEAELMATYGVGRVTVRQAVLDLVRQGYLYRHRGRGTFVCRRRSADGIEPLISFTAEMAARGLVAGARVLTLKQVKPPPAVTLKLQSGPDEKVILSRRLRTADGMPMAIETSYLSQAIIGGLTREELAGSLYQLIVHRRGLRIGRAVQAVTPAVATPDEAELLGVAPGTPVLVMERQTFLADGRPLEFMTFVYRGDIYRMETEIASGTAASRPSGRRALPDGEQGRNGE
ncbi:MAG: GntR family transcriptional regulator [Chloroflexota bacterium]